MGTSSSYGGSSSGNPLLPPWAQDSGGNDEGSVNQQDGVVSGNQETPAEGNELSHGPTLPNQTSSKRKLGGFVSSGNIRSLRKAFKGYVSGRGGVRAASRSAIGGRATAGAFGNFLSDVKREGFERTFDQLGFRNWEGKPAREVLAKLGDFLAPEGNTNEEAAARHALMDTLAQIYEEFEIEEGGIQKLDSLLESDLQNIYKIYVANYIFNRWMQEYGDYIEGRQISERELLDTEEQIRSYILAEVRLNFNDTFFDTDFNTTGGKEVIEQIFQDAYSLR